MSPEAGKDQQAYVRDIIDSAKQAVAYTHGLTFEQFWDDHKTRDAVAMRLHIMGESAKKLKAETAAKLPILRIDDIRGMRNRIAHDYGRVNFRVVWKTVRENLPPLISELEKYARQHEPAQKTQPAPSVATSPHRPSNGPRMGM